MPLQRVFKMPSIWDAVSGNSHVLSVAPRFVAVCFRSLFSGKDPLVNPYFPTFLPQLLADGTARRALLREALREQVPTAAREDALAVLPLVDDRGVAASGQREGRPGSRGGIAIDGRHLA